MSDDPGTGAGEGARTRARELFLDDANTYGCAETAFVVLKEAFGLPDAGDSAAAMALNGGIAYSGSTCGAITGAALAVGQLAAIRIGDHREAKRVARTVTGPPHRRVRGHLRGHDLPRPDRRRPLHRRGPPRIHRERRLAGGLHAPDRGRRGRPRTAPGRDGLGSRGARRREVAGGALRREARPTANGSGPSGSGSPGGAAGR